MFKKFDEKESVSGVQQLKSSIQKGIRAKLLDQFPHLESHIDLVLPKKDTFRIVKCHEHIEILINAAGELLFFRQRDGIWMPTLKLLHKYILAYLQAAYHVLFFQTFRLPCRLQASSVGRKERDTRRINPFFLPLEQVDKGAIKFVLSGANIMCPGLTSPGARMTPAPKGTVVAVMAEGKQHALAIGVTAMSTEDISKINKGIGIENCHYLNDGLWQMKAVK